MLSAGFLATLFTTWNAYQPALLGPFLLDDYVNLDRLKFYSQSTHALPWLEYISRGTTIFDRPISRLTFLIDDHAWPSNPESFKRTNLLIHLLIGTAIFRFSIALGKTSGLGARKSQLISAGITAYWLIHPLHLSTTMYIVQRMAQLSALFTIVGLTFYLELRLQKSLNRKSATLAFLTGFSFLLGMLSKPNAATFPLIILAIEATILAGRNNSIFQKNIRYLFAFLPSILLVGGVIWSWQSLNEAYAMRDFNLTERLLTQTRVLSDYLRALLMPTLDGTGVWHDDFKVSRSILDPRSTIACTMLIASLFTAAIILRKKIPVASFSILFFFAAHFIESTFVPLELYFEHRNYLPSIGILYGITFYLVTLGEWRSNKRWSALAVLVGLSILVNFLDLTTKGARIWSSRILLHEHAASHHSQSERLARNVISTLLSIDEYRKDSDIGWKRSLEIVDSLIEVFPKKASLIIEKKTLLCMNGTSISENGAQFIQELQKSSGDIWAARSFAKMLGAYRNRSCGPHNHFIYEVFQTIKDNRNIKWEPESWEVFHRNWAALYQVDRDLDAAIKHYKISWRYNPDNERLAYQIALVEMMRGNFVDAKEYAQHALNLHREKKLSSILGPAVITHLEKLTGSTLDLGIEATPRK